MILSRTKITREKKRTRKDSKEQSWQLYNETFEIQRNSPKNQTKILLKRNNRRRKIIRIRMYKVSTRKRLLQERNRTWNRTFRKDIKRSVHRSYNKVVKDVRKEQYSSNKESRIRDDIFQNSYRKRKCQESMIELLRDNVKTL